MPTKSILVTGSSGTIGTALCHRLLEKGYDVRGTDLKQNRWSTEINKRTIIADATDKSTVEQLPNTFDLVIHLAANARVHKLVQNPDLAKENFDTTFTILEYAREIGADFIFSSSREVYGNNGKIIYDETDTYVDECESPYTASKIGGEALVKSYDVCYDIDTSIVRFSNVYGKYDASNRVIPLFIAQASQGEDLTVYGDDKVLDFTYIDDCVDGVVRVVEQFNKAAGSTFNIASGEGTSLVEVAQTIVDKTDADVSINVEENRTGEVSRYVADISKASKIFGYEPSYDIDQGIEATVDWYLARQDLFDTITS
ncbi:NAD-dependent epimerase/dehydratase family protein [Halorubrum sp. HHNYT27]|uniref:NAD-dependent epimerase/dehydratase family protein n=1 Tax=Halorubrum sp. HHNYT27 TaxID=3402275 RepID=UPI003EBEC402